MKTSGILTILVLMLALGCGEKKAPSSFNGQSHRNHIIMLDSAYSKAVIKMNADSLGDCYSADAILLTPGEDMVEGKENIKTWFKNAFEYGLGSIHFEPTHISGSEDHMIEIGKSTVGMKMAGSDTLSFESYKYIHVWSKLPNGDYKLSREMWNTDMAKTPVE